MMLGAGGVLERAAVIAALSVIRLQAVHSVELRFQGDLVRRLVGGSVGHTERTLAYTRSFGWRLDGPVAVLVTATETVADAPADPTKALDVLDRLADGWRAALEPEVAGAAVAGLATEIVTLLPLDGRTPEELSALVTAGDLPGQRAAAPGRPRAGHRDRAARRSRCRRCRRPTGRRSARSGVGQEIHGAASVTHFDQLGVFRLLSLIPDSTELRTYVDEVLGPLADAADADSADLRETLRVLLETNLNVAESARRLHFHYNTMRYRIGKLERMLGPVHDRPDAAAEPAARPARGPHARPRPAAPAAGRGRVHRRAGRRPRQPALKPSPDPGRRIVDAGTSPRSSGAWRTCSRPLEGDSATRPGSSWAPTCAPPGRSRGPRRRARSRTRRWVARWDVDFAGLYLRRPARPTGRTRPGVAAALAAGVRGEAAACRPRRTSCSA